MSFETVVLDGYTLSPLEPGQPASQGHPSWAPLEQLGRLSVYPRTRTEQLLDRAAGAKALLVNKVAVDAQTMDRLPELRYVGILATGTDIVDLDAARQRGISVTNVPGYSTDSVAQHTFALLLSLVHHIREHDQSTREGAWSSQPDFSLTVAPIHELAGKRIGIVGLGAIGQRVARIADALGMQVAAWARPGGSRRDVPGLAVQWLELDALLEQCDVISLHCPLSESTRGLIGAAQLERMKPTAYLINTARGPLIDEPALAQALQRGRIAGAGLDVLSAEPPPRDHPLLGLERCIVTAHIAWASAEARGRLMRIAAENLKGYLAGEPVNVVN